MNCGRLRGKTGGSRAQPWPRHLLQTPPPFPHSGQKPCNGLAFRAATTKNLLRRRRVWIMGFSRASSLVIPIFSSSHRSTPAFAVCASSFSLQNLNSSSSNFLAVGLGRNLTNLIVKMILLVFCRSRVIPTAGCWGCDTGLPFRQVSQIPALLRLPPALQYVSNLDNQREFPVCLGP